MNNVYYCTIYYIVEMNSYTEYSFAECTNISIFVTGMD